MRNTKLQNAFKTTNNNLALLIFSFQLQFVRIDQEK